MKLLYFENEEEHEYLYDFMSSNHHSAIQLLPFETAQLLKNILL